MGCDETLHLIGAFLPESCGTLHVREQEGHRSRRRLWRGHEATVTCQARAERRPEWGSSEPGGRGHRRHPEIVRPDDMSGCFQVAFSRIGAPRS
jgi:hypothetical protein